MFKLDLEKAEEPEIKLPTSFGSSKKQENSRKTSISATLTTLKSLTVWITTKCGKFFKRWEYQITTCLLQNLYAGQEATVRTGHGTTDWFQIRKGIHQGCICYHAYLTYMKSMSCKMLGYTLHVSSINRAAIYNLDVLLSQFGTSPLSHDEF